MKKLVYILVIIIIFLVIGYFVAERYISKSNQSEKAYIQKFISVETEKAALGEISGNMEYTGTVEGIHEAFVISQTAGIVEKVFFKPGSSCREGKTIAIINNVQQQAFVEQAKAQVLAAESNYEKAQNDLKRMERLQSENVTSRDNLEMTALNVKAALAQLKGAQAALKTAEKQLADTYIKAPISGITSTKDIDIGATVAPGSRISHIVDNSSFKIVVYISETDVVKLKEGIDVNVKIDAIPDKSFNGKISSIGSSSMSGLRSYPVEVVINNKGKNEIKSGMFARCEIIGESRKGVILIPESSVIINKDGTNSIYLAENGKAVFKSLIVGNKSGGKYEVKSGIEPGQTVITSGKERLKNGISIKEK